MAQIVKHLPQCRRAMFNPWVRKIPLEKRNGYTLQYSCLEHFMDREAWEATVPGITESREQLSN